MITTAQANAMLDTGYVDGDLMSIHTAYSASGANEIDGGGYARQEIDWNAAATRSKAINGNIDFSVPAAAVCAWIGIWNAAGSLFKGMAPAGGSTKAFQLDLTNERIYLEGHGLVNGDRVVFTGEAVPAGLTVGTLYWVVGATAGDPDYFQVSSTEGGSAINLTGQASADARVSKIVPETFGGAGTFRVSAHTISL